MEKYELYELTEKGVSTAVINNIILSGINLSTVKDIGFDAFMQETGIKKIEVYQSLCELLDEEAKPYSIFALTSAGISDKMCQNLKRQGFTRLFMLKLYPELFFRQKLSLTENSVKKLKEALQSIPEGVDRSIPMIKEYLDSLCKDKDYMKDLKKSILKSLSEDYIMEEELEIKLDECYKNGSLLDKALEELALSEFIEQSLFGIKKLQANLEEFLFSMPDDKNSGLLKDYLYGVSFNRLSIDYAIPKEKIKSTLMRYPFPVLAEDEYLELYYSYYLTAEDFTKIFALDSKVFRYLELKAQRPMGKRNVLEMLEDERVSSDVRVRIQNTLGKYAKIHGISVLKTPQDILDIYARFEMKNQVEEETLYQDYRKYWFSLFHEELPITDKQLENLVDASKMIIEGKDGYRYYNTQLIDAGFFKGIRIDAYMDVEISTKIIFDATKHVMMKSFDIHDEYELYSILKKTYRKNNVEYIRKPIIVFGAGNRNNQIKSALFELSPISMADLTRAYTRIYGVKEKSFASYAAKQFSPYYSNGVFTVNTPKLKDEILEMYRGIMKADFYFIADIAQLAYQEGIPFQEYYINRNMLDALGYKDGIRCVYKDKFIDLSDMVRSFLHGEIYIDQLNPRFVALPEFKQTLGDLVDTYEYFEKEPDHYVSIEDIEKDGITKELILDFVEQVKGFVYEDEAFTIVSLKNKGFDHPIFKANYPVYFYASLFKPSKDVIYQRCYASDNVVLKIRVQKERSGITALLEQIVEAKYYVTLPDIVRDLEMIYGVYLTPGKVKQYITLTDMYCNPDTMLYYLNYESFKRMQ